MELIDYLIKTRRELHRLAELAKKEFKTCEYVCKELSRLNIRHKIIGTAVVADIAGEGKRTVAIRCDMDALPIIEKTGTDNCSIDPETMHACGHDGHMAMVLGLSRELSDKKPAVNVRLIFQPAEEATGGAEELIDAGVLNGVDEIFALHLSPDYAAGTINSAKGAILAGAVEFDVEFTGRSAHCASPDQGIDAIGAAVMFSAETKMLMLSGKFSNNLFNLGRIYGGYARNIISDSCTCECSFRYYTDDSLNSFKEETERIKDDISAATGAVSRTLIHTAYPPLVNHLSSYNLLSGLVPMNNAKAKFTAEDFAFYLQKVPGCFCWLGCRDDKFSAPLHSPYFNFDEAVLLEGVKLFKKLVY